MIYSRPVTNITNWPNLNPYIDMFINPMFLIGDVPEVEIYYTDSMTEYIEYVNPTIWPSLYPSINYKFLIGHIPEVDYVDLIPDYIEPTIWPNMNFYSSWYSLGRSNTLEYHVYDYSYNQKLSMWPNVFKGEPAHVLGNAVDYEPIYKITLEHQWISSCKNGSKYVLSHMGGTLDEILLPTLWSVENNLYRGFDTINLEEPWSYTVDLSKTNNMHTTDLYDKFAFSYVNIKDYNSNYIGLLNTVLYPNFSVLYKRYPDIRTIIISFDVDDITEIMTNTVYKIWLKKGISEFQMVRLKRVYKEFYDDEMTDIKSLKKEFIDYWINILSESAINHPTIKTYMNPEIPENNENILVLKYKDFSTIEKESYVAITKLSKFINSKITEDVIDKYKLAVQKQQTFIENFCPTHNL